MNVRELNEKDLDALFAIRQISFLDRSDFSDPALRARHAARLQHTVGHFYGDKLTSAAVCFPFEMFLAGQRVRVGGLASVLSAPETRRRGFVRDLLKGILERLHEDGVGWCLEYPFDPRFYARYGFATVPTGSEVTFPAEKLFSGPAPDAERFTGDAATVLQPIYDTWAQSYTLTLSRANTARPTWSRILTDDRFCYLLGDAYAVMELEQTATGQTLVVHDYAFATPAGRERLFRFIGAFYGQAELISLQLPNDEPLAFDLQTHHTNRLPVLQARIVDVPSALKPLVNEAVGIATGDVKNFTLHVSDPFCSWNDGVFEVAFGSPESTVLGRTTPGNAAPKGSVVASSDPPTLSLNIATLTQLLSGALSPVAAQRAGVLEGDISVSETLASLGGGRVPFMPGSDYF